MVLAIRNVVSPLIPAIVDTEKPDDVREYDLFQAARPPGIVRGVLDQYLGARDATSLVVSDYIPEFGYYAGAFSGPDLEYLHDSGTAKNVWEVKLHGISQYPYVTDPAGQFSVSRSSWKGALNFTSTLWAKKLVGGDVANSKGFTGKGVKVAVVDTGSTNANPSTPLIKKRTAVDANFVDLIGHGEWCLGSIVGRTVKDHLFSQGNKKDVICEGVAPEAEGYGIKALDYAIGEGSTYQLLKAWQIAIRLGINVCSNSWGGASPATTPDGDPFNKPLRTLVEIYGMIVLAAAGNSGPNASTLDSPGMLPDALTVGSYNAIDNSAKPSFGAGGEVSGFSSRGPTNWGDVKPDVVAPGAIIDGPITGWMSASYEGKPHAEVAIAGTSMATPMAAGIVICMYQAHQKLLGKQLTTDEIKQMMAALGQQEKSNDSGWGPLNWSTYEQWLGTQYGVTLKKSP